MTGSNPSAMNVGNVLTAQAILFDKELIPNLKGQTDAFLAAAEKRVQGLHMGINRTMYQYETLGASTASVTDGSIGNPETISQLSIAAQVGEHNNYANFSAMSVAAAIDDLPGNSAVELGYQAGQSISELYSSVADSAAGVDSTVEQSGLLVSPFTLDLGTIRELKQQMVSHNILPCKKGRFYGAISPNVLGDIYNSTTVNNSIVDLWKMGNIDKFDDIASSDQTKDILLPGTGIVFRQTPFVTKTADYESGTATAFRTYVFGNFAMIGIWLQVPGDTQLGDGDWKTIKTSVAA